MRHHHYEVDFKNPDQKLSKMHRLLVVCEKSEQQGDFHVRKEGVSEL